ncbi:MAG: hypothetical protein WBV53_08405 [Solirubrobacterales bacterium]
MRKRLLIGAAAAALGALSFSSVASAVPTSQTLQATLSPTKLDKKHFGGVKLRNIIGTTFDNFATSQSPRQTVFTVDPNIRFVNGNVPACQLSQIQGKFDAQAKTACPKSIVGSGTVQVNGGMVGGTVTIFGGGPKTMYVQTDIGPGATSLTIIGTIAGRTLTFSNIPNTPGLVLSNFDTTFNKRKTGKKTYYVMARCKSKKWVNREATTFYSGETLSASSKQKCKQKGSKKK